MPQTAALYTTDFSYCCSCFFSETENFPVFSAGILYSDGSAKTILIKISYFLLSDCLQYYLSLKAGVVFLDGRNFFISCKVPGANLKGVTLMKRGTTLKTTFY